MSKNKQRILPIGIKIKARRKALGLTQEELAEKINCSFKTIGNIENNNTVPDTRQIINLCDALEMSFDDMFSDILQKREPSYSTIETQPMYLCDSSHENGDPNDSHYLINRVIIKPIRPQVCIQLQEYITAHLTKMDETQLNALKTVMDCLIEKTPKK